MRIPDLGSRESSHLIKDIGSGRMMCSMPMRRDQVFDSPEAGVLSCKQSQGPKFRPLPYTPYQFSRIDLTMTRHVSHDISYHP